jgi:hypothetical protein
MRRNGIFRAPSKIPVRFGGIGTQRVPRSLRGRGRVNIYVREQSQFTFGPAVAATFV